MANVAYLSAREWRDWPAMIQAARKGKIPLQVAVRAFLAAEGQCQNAQLT
jgi:hypothetical protein